MSGAAAPGIDGAARIYAVLGDPIAQVQTPRLINPVFARHGAGIVAVPFRVPAALFDAAWSTFAAIPNVAGIAVTVPHKRAAALRCARLTPAAAAVGAVNCARREPDGAMLGAQFDGVGFVEGLGRERARLGGAVVLLVGAGGAGRAIAHALAQEPIARIHLIDRDAAAAEAASGLADRAAGRSVASPAPLALAGCDVLINATPAGLAAGDAFPVPLDGLRPATLVADIAGLARETELLAGARRRGCAVIDGTAMLEAQIGLVAGFVAGLPPGTRIGEAAHAPA